MDTARLTWTRAQPWRPPQDARTLVRHSRCATCAQRSTAEAPGAQEEVSKALPGNTVLAQPLNTAPARDPAEALSDWGGQWRGAKRQ